MFNYNAFTPTQSSPNPHTPNHHLNNSSPSSYFPNSQPNSTWGSPSQQQFYTPQDSQTKDTVPYDVRALLENEEHSSSTSSDSEETDTMPEVSPKFKTNFIKEWDFGQIPANRRKSEILTSNNSLLQNLIASPENSQTTQARTWSPFIPSKTNVKPAFFGPLNKTGFVQNEKRAFFVTLEGFKLENSQRFFKIERLCHSMQSRNSNDANNFGQFLYLSLWNDWHNGQEASENIFEPWIYSIPNLNFKLVVKVHMSHSNEDAHIFDFIVDLRSHALPTKERRNQSLEVVYTEPSNPNSPGISSGNNITMHIQLTNEKLLVPHGFKNVQDVKNAPNSYAVILRQIFIGLPLCRAGSTCSPISPLLQQIHRPQQPRDVYAKRGSAIVLGRNARPGEGDARSPLSWSNFSPEMSPNHHFTPPKHHNSDVPSLPPGIMGQNAIQEGFVSNPSQFKTQGQRFSFKQQRERRESAEGLVTRRPHQNNEFARFMEQEGRPVQLLEDFVNGGNKDIHRRASLNTDSVALSSLSSLHKFHLAGLSAHKAESDTQYSVTSSTVNISSYDSMADVAPFDDDMKGMDVNMDFKIEDYVGKIAEFVKTYQGSKVLQNYVITSKKEDLDIVFQEIGERIGDLMLDPYANYMIQTLVQNGLPRQRVYFLQKLAPTFTSIARDKKGTHSLQAIVAQIDSQEEFTCMKNILGNSVLDLSLDPRANYVIQKLVNIIPVDASAFLYQPLLDNFVQVANNSFGLLVLKQMMARVEQVEPLKQKVIDLASINFEKLVQNPYGNYAIQHIIEFYSKDAQLIVNKILTKIIPYSSQKISSNIIEKCLAVCDYQFRKRAVEEILKNGRLSDLMKNKYGNFVTLQLLATATLLDKQRLMQEILKCANSFNGTKYKTRWLKFVDENPLKISWNSNQNYEQEQGNDDDEIDDNLVAKDLEAVKRIWREMTKEEKGDSPGFPSQNRGGYGKKPHYHNKNDGYGSWHKN